MNDDHFVQTILEIFPNYKISIQDMLQPTSEFVVNYYTLMIEQITHIKVKDLCLFTQEQAEFMSSLVGNAVPEPLVYKHNLYIAVKFILDRMNRTGMSFSDILFPYLSPKRSGLFMKGMLEFLDFCSDFDAKYEEVNQLNSMQERAAELQNSNATLKRQIAEMIELRQQKEEESEMLKLRQAELAEQNEQYQNMLKDLTAQRDTEDERLRTAEEQENKLQEQLRIIQNDKRYLESLVVANEDDIVSQHASLLKKREESRKKVQDLDRKVHEKAAMNATFDEILLELEKLNNILHEATLVANTQHDLSSLFGLFQELKKECQALQQTKLELQEKIKERDEISKPILEKLKALRKQEKTINATLEEMKITLDLKLNELRNELSKNTTEMAKLKLEADENLELQEKYGREISEIETFLTEENAKGREKYVMLKAQVDSIIAALKNSILND